MNRFSLRALCCCVIGAAAFGFGQVTSTESSVRLSVLVNNALARALPSPADVTARVWQRRGVNDKLSRSEFMTEYEAAQNEYSRDAHIQLQPAYQLFKQLNAIETMVVCAHDVNHELMAISREASDGNGSWQRINSSWDAVFPTLPCASGEDAKKAATANGRSSLVEDKDVKLSLDAVIVRVQKATAEVAKAVKMRDQANLVRSTRILANQLELFCVVAAVQLTVLSKDLRELNPTMGNDHDTSSQELAKLQQLLAQAPEN
jgi:hypothetical protein